MYQLVNLSVRSYLRLGQYPEVNIFGILQQDNLHATCPPSLMTCSVKALQKHYRLQWFISCYFCARQHKACRLKYYKMLVRLKWLLLILKYAHEADCITMLYCNLNSQEKVNGLKRILSNDINPSAIILDCVYSLLL